MQEFSDAEVTAKAVQLGVIEAGQELPRNMRSRVVAALMQERRAAAAPSKETPAAPQLAREIVVQPGGDITVDGAPFPWLVASEPMDIHLSPRGDCTVRLTLLAEAVQIIKPKSENESETS